MFKTIRNIKRIAGEQAKILRFPIIMTIIDTLFNMVMFSTLIFTLGDLLTNTFTTNKLMFYTIVCFIIFIIRCFTHSIAYVQVQYRGSDIATKLRITLGNHVRSLNLGYFNHNSIGKLTGSLTTDISDFEQVITHSLTNFVNIVVFTMLALSFSFVIDVRFTVAIAGLVILGIPLLNISGKKANQNSMKLRGAINNVVSRVVEYMSGIKTFKLYNLTGQKFERLENSFSKLKDESIHMELSVVPYSISFSMITSWIIPVALILGTIFLKNGELTKASFISLVLLSISISNMFTAMGSLYPQIRFLDRASQNITEIMDEKPLAYTKDTVSFRNYDVEFKDVSFQYTDNVKVLKNINFIAKNNTKTALIGPSGSGKTTIISLISRFWDVQKGAISIGEENLKQINPDFICENIAVVFQNVYLLNDTFMNNIKLGNPKASEQEVIEAAKAANCHDFIMSKEGGYQGIIGEGGATLSGGEKQRISIARAFIKNASIILLDESTSSLDADNEYEIGVALDNLMQNKTAIVIAHRLNTITSADNIIVLDEGEILEQGNHNDLLKQDGWYKQMYNEQQKAKGWIV